MAQTAAYTGLRWGELAALTADQLDPAIRVMTVDRKVVEIAGHLYVEAPKNRKWRRTIYPRATPAGDPLAERVADRTRQARAEHRPVHLETRRHRRLPDGRPRQLPHHPRHIRRHHRRRPRPRPHRHPITEQRRQRTATKDSPE